MTTKKTVAKKATVKKAVAKKTITKTKKNAKGQTVFDGSISLGGKTAPKAGLVKKAVAKKPEKIKKGKVKETVAKSPVQVYETEPIKLMVDKSIRFTQPDGVPGNPLFGWSGEDTVDRFAAILRGLNSTQIKKLSDAYETILHSDNGDYALGQASQIVGGNELEDLADDDLELIESYGLQVGNDFYTELDVQDVLWAAKWHDIMPSGLSEEEEYEFEGVVLLAQYIDRAVRARNLGMSKVFYNTITNPWRKLVGALRVDDPDIFIGA